MSNKVKFGTYIKELEMSLKNSLNITLSVLLMLGFSLSAKDYKYAKGEIVYKPAPKKCSVSLTYVALQAAYVLSDTG